MIDEHQTVTQYLTKLFALKVENDRGGAISFS